VRSEYVRAVNISILASFASIMGKRKAVRSDRPRKRKFYGNKHTAATDGISSSSAVSEEVRPSDQSVRPVPGDVTSCLAFQAANF